MFYKSFTLLQPHTTILTIIQIPLTKVFCNGYPIKSMILANDQTSCENKPSVQEIQTSIPFGWAQ